MIARGDFSAFSPDPEAFSALVDYNCDNIYACTALSSARVALRVYQHFLLKMVRYPISGEPGDRELCVLVKEETAASLESVLIDVHGYLMSPCDGQPLDLGASLDGFMPSIAEQLVASFTVLVRPGVVLWIMDITLGDERFATLCRILASVSRVHLVSAGTLP